MPPRHRPIECGTPKVRLGLLQAMEAVQLEPLKPIERGGNASRLLWYGFTPYLFAFCCVAFGVQGLHFLVQSLGLRRGARRRILARASRRTLQKPSQALRGHSRARNHKLDTAKARTKVPNPRSQTPPPELPQPQNHKRSSKLL